MLTTGNPKTKKRSPSERIANRQRIAQDKARAKRWAERRNIKKSRGSISTNHTELEVPIVPQEI